MHLLPDSPNDHLTYGFFDGTVELIVTIYTEEA